MRARWLLMPGAQAHGRLLAIGIGCLIVGSAAVILTQPVFTIALLNAILLACIGALALNLQMGTAAQISLGNSGFMALGAFVAVGASRLGWPLPLGVIAATIVAGLVGIITGIPALRLRGLYLALSSIAAYYIIVYFCSDIQTRSPGDSGFLVNPTFASRGLQGGQQLWAIMLTILVCFCIYASSRLVQGKSGRAWRMIRDHQLAAPTMGIGVTRYKLAVFGIAFAAIGAEGSLQLYLNASVTIDSFTLLLAVQYVAMVVIGGLDSVPGSVIGAVLVTGLPVWTTDLLGSSLGTNSTLLGPEIATVVFGALIVLFVTLSPQGVVGWVRPGGVLRTGIRLPGRDAARPADARDRSDPDRRAPTGPDPRAPTGDPTTAESDTRASG
jgi:branched-chain amino acid transport system permease protein